MKKVIFIILVFIIFSCENKIEEINNLTHEENFPDISAKNIEIIYTDNGKVKVILFAKKLEKYIQEKKTYTEFEKGINVKFFDENGILESSMVSDYARYYDKKHIFVAESNVIAKNHLKNEQLNTEYLVWEQEKELIYSDKFVKITRKDNIIYGNGFQADQNFTNLKIREVKGIISINE